VSRVRFREREPPCRRNTGWKATGRSQEDGRAVEKESEYGTGAPDGGVTQVLFAE
jgi:hypothetical protein